MNAEMEQRIETMASVTFEAIAPDLGMTDCNPSDFEGAVLCVCDAEHMLSFGHDEEAFRYWQDRDTRPEAHLAVRNALRKYFGV